MQRSQCDSAPTPCDPGALRVTIGSQRCPSIILGQKPMQDPCAAGKRRTDFAFHWGRENLHPNRHSTCRIVGYGGSAAGGRGGGTEDDSVRLPSMAGRPDTEVAKLAGHKDASVTRRIYAHWLTDDHDPAALESLDGIAADARAALGEVVPPRAVETDGNKRGRAASASA